MRRLTVPFLIAVGLMSMFAAGAAPGQQTTLNATDRRFAQQATEGSRAEVQLAAKVLIRRPGSTVSAYAQRMEADYNKAINQLTALALAQNISLTGGIGYNNQNTINRLMKLAGNPFYLAYANEQVQAHNQAIALFQQEVHSGANPALRDFAHKSLPTLQEHLRMAHNLAKEANAAYYHQVPGL